MELMGSLKRVADEITRKLEDGSLAVTNGGSPNSVGRTLPLSSARPAPRFSTDAWLAEESLTEAQFQRRSAIMIEVVQRYIFDKYLDPLPDDELRAIVKSYDHLFTAAGIPTDQLRDVYAEAMKTHGPYLLKVDDYLRAWGRIKPKMRDGVDLRAMGSRDPVCAICRGAGTVKKFIPNDVFNPLAGGRDVEVQCPYRCQSLPVRRSA
jgi:hypothetical protein